MKHRTLLVAIACMWAIACAQLQPEGVEETTVPDGSLVGSFEEVTPDASTRATFTSDYKFCWSEDDMISVLTSVSRQPYILASEAGRTQGTFCGSLRPGESILDRIAFPDAVVTGLTSGSVTVNLPAAYEYGDPFTFGSGGDPSLVLPCWAQLAGGAFTMKHLGGYFVFKIGEIPAGADRFVFRVTNGKRINGEFTADLTLDSPRLPSESAASVAEQTVTVTFPASPQTTRRSFVIPVPPGSYSYQWRVYEGSAVRGFGSQGSPVYVSRSQICGREANCSSIGGEETGPSVPSGNIVFADEYARSACVRCFDADGDGELSYAEAAAVTVIPSDFLLASERARITSFDELQHFTGLKTISNSAFENCTRLTSVIVPGGAIGGSYGGSVFKGCTRLENVILKEGVTFIGYRAFQDCSSLTSVVIPEGVTSIDAFAFDGCSSLTSINIPEGVTSLGAHTFYYCSSLTSIVIPESVTSIGDYAFYCCSSLTSAIILEGVTSIGSYAFEGCSSLTSIVIPESVTSIGSSAFSGCRSLTSAVIPEGVTSIGSHAFYWCSGLTSVVIPEGVTSIGDFAFSGCSGLTSVVISEGVTSIESYAFFGCSGLTSIVIPGSVTAIRGAAFWNCSSLTSVVISEGVTSIGDSAFSGCSSLASVVIPEGVTSIGDSAFSGCSGLTSIVIPEGVTSIGDRTFYGCSSMTSVVIPEGVTSIGDSAFSGCSGLTSINIPEGVTSIGESTFQVCISLTSIVIPENVTSIGGFAFSGCSSLISVTIKSEAPPMLTTIIFQSEPSTMQIFVPAGSVDAYKSAETWSNFASQIFPIEE